MNNEKLNTQSLINQVSLKTGDTKKDVESFLKEFITLIQEQLLSEKIVKIKDLGTFKLSWNDSRKSVNVQTGESIEIPGHYKVVFTPDNALKETINAPYAHLETVLLDDVEEESNIKEKVDPIKNLSIQAQELASVISEIKTTSAAKVEDKDSEQEIQKPLVESVIEEVKENISQQDTQSQQSINHTENSLIEPVQSEIISEQTSSPIVINDDKEATASEIVPKKKTVFWKWFLPVCIILSSVMLYVCWNELLQCQFFDIIKGDKHMTENVAVVDTFEVVPDTSTQIEINDSTVANTPDNQTFSDADFLEEFNPNDYTTTEFVAEKGTRLARLADQYYGSYIFWPYIYLANKENLQNPNNISECDVIKIPKLPSHLIDTSDIRAVDRAKFLETQLK